MMKCAGESGDNWISLGVDGHNAGQTDMRLGGGERWCGNVGMMVWWVWDQESG
jgi:hypothetical protein